MVSCRHLQNLLEKHAHPSFFLDLIVEDGNYCHFDVRKKQWETLSYRKRLAGGAIEIENDKYWGEVPFEDELAAIRRIIDCGATYLHSHTWMDVKHVHFTGSGVEVKRCLINKLLEEP